MKSPFLKSNLTVEEYFGENLGDITNNKKMLDQIINCYINVFNESWGEKWDYSSASREIIDSFSYDRSRIPVATFLLKGSDIIGFSWGVITDRNHLIPERDMPFRAKIGEKLEGINFIKYWLDLKKQEKILVFREIGVIRDHRGKRSLSLSYPIIRRARDLSCKYIMYWTSPTSASFNLGLSIGFWPIKVFLKENIILLVGKMDYTYEILNRLRNKMNLIGRFQSLKQLKHNLAKY